MKKIGHILVLTVILISMMNIGMGISFIRCAHSGTLTILTESNSHDIDCQSLPDCMTVENIHFSPTTLSHTVDFDYHVFVPMVFEIISYTSDLTESIPTPAIRQAERIKGPPRLYLSVIQSFLI
ncbi:MAG: hypothetical protein ACI31D_04375 [Candidatus Limisoma sp.]